jgi:hypothetical protein
MVRARTMSAVGGLAAALNVRSDADAATQMDSKRDMTLFYLIGFPRVPTASRRIYSALLPRLCSLAWRA